MLHYFLVVPVVFVMRISLKNTLALAFMTFAMASSRLFICSFAFFLVFLFSVIFLEFPSTVFCCKLYSKCKVFIRYIVKKQDTAPKFHELRVKMSSSSIFSFELGNASPEFRQIMHLFLSQAPSLLLQLN